MSSWTCARLSLCTVAAVLLQAVGVSVFVLGFFPVKPALSGVSGPESFFAPWTDPSVPQNGSALPPHQLKSLYQELSELPPSFDRLVFMVVDGLPAEFVLGKDNEPPSKAFKDAMPYMQSLLASGMAIGYHAKAAPPTVTMPRLKAMVSGAVGGFLDVAFNFNTHALLDDNLLGQFLKIGWRMVMLGDETWLKLFPGYFTRHDGVSSFFVKDTVQVDSNVSRHLADELSRNDWDLLILHYLGLDHVGHIGGRNSVLMAPKLMEMDEVVKMIHLNISTKQQLRTLLMVVSDHGMTENGNHGGSSYEESDSLALFIGPEFNAAVSVSSDHNTAQQVDIASTLALLFGVPIPKNNVGVILEAASNFLTDDQKLRALELNTWQLFRLLQAQLPDLSCGNFPCEGLNYDEVTTTGCKGSINKMFCCLYKNAVVLHCLLKSKIVPRFNINDEYSSVTAAYHGFLRTASEWLSRTASDKPVSLLASGIAAMLLSSLSLWSLMFGLCREVYLIDGQGFRELKNNNHRWHLDEIFIFVTILILVISMGSSSMVEEEQYIWHFVTSTLHLIFFRKTMQTFQAKGAENSFSMTKEQNKRICSQVYSILLVLVCGRILRGWHQGGVNWTHLPDMSKWLEQAGSEYIKLTQLASGILLILISLSFLLFVRLKRKTVLVVGFMFLVPGLLVLQHTMKYKDITFLASNYGETLLAQVIYVILGIITFGAVMALPWLMPKLETYTAPSLLSAFLSSGAKKASLMLELRDASQLIGWAYVFSWCLLQLLLQQPLNSMPILLLFVQILATLIYYAYSGPVHKQWVVVAALYFLGMAGHYGLGNSNTLATIDVAGAFIGISSYSTLLSGILMFIITYASPMLALLSLVMYISMKDAGCHLFLQNAGFGDILKIMIGVPCLVPLGLNSVLLSAYTIILLLMQNHLFVWSVFSPKYLYVCASTVSVYIGVSIVAATMLYIFLVLFLRRKMQDFYEKDAT